MKVRFRLTAIVATIVTAFISVGLGFSAAPAQAAGTCSLLIPSKVRISTPYQAVTGRLSSNCATAGTTDASWTAYHPTQGAKEFLWFYPSTSLIWDVYSWWITPAVYTWRPSGASDANYDPIAQNQPTTVVRVGSGASIYTSRSGSYVTIKTSSSRYAYSISSWVRWGGIRGTIQYWGPTGWTNMKYAYQNTSGYYTYRFYAPKARSYRVVFADTSSIWGSVSGSSYR